MEEGKGTMRFGQENNEELEKDFHAEIFHNREDAIGHSKYAQEKFFSALITEGNVEKLKELLQDAAPGQGGRMSHNSFRQQLYAIIVGIAVATRAALEGGMYEEEAYTLSDLYIQKADCCNSTEELWRMYVRAVCDFAGRVKNSKQ